MDILLVGIHEEVKYSVRIDHEVSVVGWGVYEITGIEVIESFINSIG